MIINFIKIETKSKNDFMKNLKYGLLTLKENIAYNLDYAFYIYTNNEVDFVDVDIDNNNDNNEPLSSRDFRRMSMDVVFFNMLNSQKCLLNIVIKVIK